MEVDDLPIELEVADALKIRTPDDGYGRELYRRKDCQHDNLHGGQLGILHRGRVAYCNEVKHHVLGVSEADLNTFGAVSQRRGADGPWNYAGIGM